METQPILLNEFIKKVKDDLAQDILDNVSSPPMFIMDEVTVEVNFVVKSNEKGGISLFEVVSYEGGHSKETVHKAVVTLKPLLEVEEVPKPDRKERF